MEFEKWLKKNKNRWHKQESMSCPYCYYDAEWLDIKRLGEWAWEEKLQCLRRAFEAYEKMRKNFDLLMRRMEYLCEESKEDGKAKQLEEIVIVCLGKKEFEKRESLRGRDKA